MIEEAVRVAMAAAVVLGAYAAAAWAASRYF